MRRARTSRKERDGRSDGGGDNNGSSQFVRAGLGGFCAVARHAGRRSARSGPPTRPMQKTGRETDLRGAPRRREGWEGRRGTEISVTGTEISVDEPR